MGLSRRSRSPLAPLPADPGDLSWTPVVVQGVPQNSHWFRTDDLQVHLISTAEGDGFTIVHDGRPVTDRDAADVVELLGLAPADVTCTYRGSGRSRAFKCPRVLGVILQELLAATPAEPRTDRAGPAIPHN